MTENINQIVGEEKKQRKVFSGQNINAFCNQQLRIIRLGVPTAFQMKPKDLIFKTQPLASLNASEMLPFQFQT